MSVHATSQVFMGAQNMGNLIGSIDNISLMEKVSNES
jgi:hypothetical protein